MSEKKKCPQHTSSKEKMMLNMYKQYLPKDKSSLILDLGCGYGEMVGALQDQNYINVSGYDVGEDQIKKGIELGVKNISVLEINKFILIKMNTLNMTLLYLEMF